MATSRIKLGPIWRSLLIGIIGLTPSRYTRAEDVVSYKYQDYREAAGRIAVQVHSMLIEKNLGPDMQLRVSGVVDTIAGATPNGQPPPTPDGQVPLSQLSEKRKAWSADLSKQFSRIKLTAGLANSRESDYVSNSWSLNTTTDFNTKNTTLTLGIAETDDDVKVFFQQQDLAKNTFDFIAGITQLLDPLTALTLNITRSRASGYLSDPYKLILKDDEIFPGIFLLRTFNENRPNVRTKWIALGALNRSFPNLSAAVDASYRFHSDDWGITSHTINLEWYQKLGSKVILRPSLRYYKQSSADFYYITLVGSPIQPSFRPTGMAPFYSADYRLSEMDTLTYGLKLVWNISDAWLFDVTAEKYDMQRRDGVTSPSAYPNATIITTGLRFAF